MERRDEPGGPDAIMTRIGQVVMLLHAGDREEARTRFGALWDEIGERGDPLHRCTLAHYMADTQDDPEDELAWDLRALRAADAVTARGGTEPRGGPGGPDSPDSPGRSTGAAQIRGFYPSLHLNLAASYAKVDEDRLARSHLGLARKACDALADDAYGDGVRAAVARMELRLLGSDQLP
ncbi:hypothetical protein ACIO6U_17300 [Streptomyces sp. NPDC087422]|uniref:hypothetical protein n=1 Tax=Streptomyces sp. NPDC087422 TaxID=3365786 RepID=UPI0037F308E2